MQVAQRGQGLPAPGCASLWEPQPGLRQSTRGSASWDHLPQDLGPPAGSAARGEMTVESAGGSLVQGHLQPGLRLLAVAGLRGSTMCSRFFPHSGIWPLPLVRNQKTTFVQAAETARRAWGLWGKEPPLPTPPSPAVTASFSPSLEHRVWQVLTLGFHRSFRGVGTRQCLHTVLSLVWGIQPFSGWCGWSWGRSPEHCWTVGLSHGARLAPFHPALCELPAMRSSLPLQNAYLTLNNIDMLSLGPASPLQMCRACLCICPKISHHRQQLHFPACPPLLALACNLG